MFSESAKYYDLIYLKFKNYREESEKIITLLDNVHPGAKTVLDVACGTGEHAKYLSEKYQVDGIDIEPQFVEIAQQKNPGGKFSCADMADFDLGKQYDVVMCLFSSIGYVKTLDKTRKTFRLFRSHLAEGGFILVEPWLTPARWKPGNVFMKTIEQEDLKICRMSHAGVKGKISIITMEYLIGTDRGIEKFSELHELGLFTAAEMQRCFAEANLTVEYDPVGIYDRGLYIARKA
jgi:SAM-dependent methyltransferase